MSTNLTIRAIDLLIPEYETAEILQEHELKDKHTIVADTLLIIKQLRETILEQNVLSEKIEHLRYEMKKLQSEHDFYRAKAEEYATQYGA